MRRSVLVPCLLLLAIAACDRLSEAGAERLVRAYNEKLIEAYRTGDELVVDPLVGPEEGKKLLGLIGVRRDMGINLDSRLVEFLVTGIERSGEKVRVRTAEKWHYADRRIGTGEQVGEASDDVYDLAYTLARIDGRWVVEKVEMVSEPVVGRKTAPWSSDQRVMHGLLTAPTPGAGRERDGGAR